MQSEIREATPSFVKVIGREFDVHGGDLVVLLECRCRGLEEIAGRPSLSTRARIRQLVETSLVRQRYRAAIDSIGLERRTAVEKAMREAKRVYGKYWLADSLIAYYGEDDFDPSDNFMDMLDATFKRVGEMIGG